MTITEQILEIPINSQGRRRYSAAIKAALSDLVSQGVSLQLIAEGHSSKDIGRILRISTKTVETHRTQLMRRLHIHDIAGLVRYAVRIGLVSAER